MNLTLNLSAPGISVPPNLLGHNLEFTRHDLFAGLSAELLANRKFATLVPCSEDATNFTCWPNATQRIAAASPGFASRWHRVGNASLDAPYWASASPLVTGDRGHSVRCTASATECGVWQGSFEGGYDPGPSAGSGIAVEAGVSYTLRLVLRGGAEDVAVAVTLADAGGALGTASFVAGAGDWRTQEAVVVPARTSASVTLAITAARAASAWWLGSASLTRADRTWRGMRTDVIDSLKAIGFRGLLRYPGGCFAPFYRWKVGLLPADERPPLATPPGYCFAVAGGVDAYTDGFVENGVGVDDFLALCDELGMAPALTVRLQFATDDELDEAADLIEYLNGDAATPFGRLRAARGRAAPYNVRHWYLGNEMDHQDRYPDYPRSLARVPPPAPDEYATLLGRLVPRMLGASPAPLRLLTVAATAPPDRAAAWNAGASRATPLSPAHSRVPASCLLLPPPVACSVGARGRRARLRRQLPQGVRAARARLRRPFAERPPPPQVRRAAAVALHRRRRLRRRAAAARHLPAEGGGTPRAAGQRERRRRRRHRDLGRRVGAGQAVEGDAPSRD